MPEVKLSNVKSDNFMITSVSTELISIKRFNSYQKLVNVTARIFCLKVKPCSFKQIGEKLEIKLINYAIFYWVEKVKIVSYWN